jgi:hypothetical protein
MTGWEAADAESWKGLSARDSHRSPTVSEGHPVRGVRFPTRSRDGLV